MFKKRIGITQKVIEHPVYNEVMCCLDTNWSKFLTNINILPVPLPLLPAEVAGELWMGLKLDGLILSGGNTLSDYADKDDDPTGVSLERDIFEYALLKAALSTNSPVFGVCRGLQLINVYYGGKLEKVEGHSGSKHNLYFEGNEKLYKFCSKVNSYHNFAVPRRSLGTNLVPLAWDKTDNIEAFCNPNDRILAIMWHPERDINQSRIDCDLIKGHFGI